MNELHSLLKRQLRRFIGETGSLLQEQPDFLQAINDAYSQFDADRRMLEHSLELTSQELIEANAELSRSNIDLEKRVMARTAELSDSEARFRELFEHAPVSIWEEDFSAVRQYIDDLRATGIVDFSAYFDAHPEAVVESAALVKIVDVNRATLEMYQAESKSQLLADLSKVLGPESLIPFKEELLVIARGETSYESETINYTLRGERRVVFVRLTVAPGSEQTWVKVFVGISDITERRLAESALAAERNLLQALMDNIPDTIYFKDTASRFIRINRAQVRVLGVSTAEEATGKTDSDFFQNSELVQSFHDEEQRIIQTGKPLTNRIEFNPTREGKPRWFAATKVPVTDSMGDVIGIVGVSRDITEQKQSEEALSQSEERFRLMAWATQDAVWDWDLQLNQIWWGEGLHKIFRYSSDTTQTNPEWRLDHIHPQDRAKVNRVIDQTIDGGMEFWSKEYRFQRVDGTYADIMDRAYIIRDKDGRASRMIGAMMDVTDRKQIEEIVRNQNDMLSGLYQITLDLLKYRDIDALLNAMVGLSAKFLDATFSEILLMEGEELVVKAAAKNQGSLVGRRMSRGDAVLSWQAVDTRRHVVLEDYSNWSLRGIVYNNQILHAVVTYPIMNDDECLGVLGLGRDKPGYEFTTDQIQFGSLLANLTAVILNNAQLREALREQSIRDPLTGLFNRRYMEETLKREISRVTRHLHPLGIIMLDIDHFKHFNDTHGHPAGDVLLHELGKLLQSHIRGGDVACRYGGEEFLLIMPDASLEAAHQRAKQLQQEAKKLRVQDAGQSFDGVTLSLGIAIYPEHGRNIDSVLRAADAALYRAKQEGRDRVVVAERAY